MNSRERVLTAFAHEQPDRVPAWCGASAEFWANAKNRLNLDDEALRLYFGDDFRRVSARYVGPVDELSPGVTSRTPFGVPRNGFGYGQAITHPLAGAAPRQIHEYSWPDPSFVDVSCICSEVEAYQGQFAILGGEWSPFWHDLIDLLGMENMYLKMYDEPELIDTILRHIVDYYVAVNQRVLDAAGKGIDIFFIGNDFGSQRGPLLSEAMFRRFILPCLARLVDIGHAYGLQVMLHCCGGFAELIPAMIEVGVDALHGLQPCCRGMEPHRLKAQFGDKIVLNGVIDSHHVLIDGTPDEVRHNTRQILKIMMPGGGYIAGASHDTILLETPLENVLAMFDTVQEYGVYEATRIDRIVHGLSDRSPHGS
jgi:uroporphyrinogen decarboxylase